MQYIMFLPPQKLHHPLKGMRWMRDKMIELEPLFAWQILPKKIVA